MHASVGGEVQSNPVSSVLTAQLSAGSQDTRGEDLGDLVQALGRGHQLWREGVRHDASPLPKLQQKN
jgi:hypothetical protein